MTNFKAGYAGMQETATTMRSNKDQIITLLTDTRRRVSELVASDFVTDTASGRFDDVATEFDAAANKTMETLPILSDWLDKAVAAVEQMDNEMANSLKT